MNPRLISALCLLMAGAATSPAPVVSASASQLSFSAFVGSESLPQKVTFTNTGKDPIEAHGAAIQPSDSTLFAVRDDCPATLVPTQFCTAVVIFTPARPGPATATLEFAGRRVAVSGTGIAPGPAALFDSEL